MFVLFFDCYKFLTSLDKFSRITESKMPNDTAVVATVRLVMQRVIYITQDYIRKASNILDADLMRKSQANYIVAQ